MPPRSSPTRLPGPQLTIARVPGRNLTAVRAHEHMLLPRDRAAELTDATERSEQLCTKSLNS